MNQVILDTDNPDVKMIMRTSGASIQFMKQETEKGAEVPISEGVTEQTIVVTRTILSTLES